MVDSCQETPFGGVARKLMIVFSSVFHFEFKFLSLNQHVPNRLSLPPDDWRQHVWTVRKSKNGCFLAIFMLILAMFLTFQSYDFDAFAHAGAPLGVEILRKIL